MIHIMGTNAENKFLVNDITPAFPVHPGSILGEELKARGISQKLFAESVGLQALTYGEAQRIGPGNCLTKTQGCANSKDEVCFFFIINNKMSSITITTFRKRYFLFYINFFNIT